MMPRHSDSETIGRREAGRIADPDRRQPWHYDVFEGRPDWSREMARQHVMQRQKENEDARRRDLGAKGEGRANR
jgi:hypothetical protein